MKRYITYILATLSLVYIASCTQSDEIANPNDSGHMVLLFQSSTMTRSADDTAGLNEDLITSIDCYFYPNGGENSDAVWHYSEDNLTVNGSHTISNTLMPAGDMAKVFPSGATQGTMYVIANYTGNDLPSGENLAGSSIAALKQKVVTTTWPQGGSWQAQDSFVMDGQSTISKGEGNAISGTVNLTRAAAKIELTITSIDTEVKGTDGCTYVPALNGGAEFGLTMHNAATKSYIDNAWDGSKLAYNADATSGHNSLAGYTFTADGSQFKQTNPLYSYPTHWGAGPSGEAYLLLVVPWLKTKDADGNDVTNETPKPYYYEIPIGKLENNVISEHIARNHHYQISIHVGTLGSFVQEEPVTLTPSYMVVDWTSGKIEAEIKDQRYLVVDQNNVEIFNKTQAKIGYNSSHDVEVMIDKIEYDNYRLDNTRYVLLTSSGKTYTTDSSSTAQSNLNDSNDTHVYADYKVSLDVASKTFSVEHSLTAKTMYVPHKVYVTIRHSEEGYQESFSQQVVITQYPPIYIVAKPNSKPNSTGGVYVNGGSNYGGVHGLTGNNANPNMYVINITSLPDNTRSIGDPRTSVIDNELDNGNTTWSTPSRNFLYAESGTTQRRMLYYYPTADNTQTVIAPKFRIASSYGVTNSVGWTNAQNRCATYQEDGYPAGRWRIPTEEEIKFIAGLSADSIIPLLFGSSTTSNTYYWTGSGSKFASADKEIVTSNQTTYVRCVYDEWYWGSEQLTNKTTFTWGDMPR